MLYSVFIDEWVECTRSKLVNNHLLLIKFNLLLLLTDLVLVFRLPISPIFLHLLSKQLIFLFFVNQYFVFCQLALFFQFDTLVVFNLTLLFRELRLLMADDLIHSLVQWGLGYFDV